MIGNSQEIPFSPTEPFRFCPADGARLSDPHPGGGVSCPACGRTWYRNSVPSVGAVIVEDGKALVTVRAHEPEKGKVDVPGGFLDVGEHPVDGLVREIREELGVEAEIIGDPVLLATHTYGPDGVWVLAICYRARIAGGNLKPADDVAEVRWISAEEIEDVDFAWEHDRGFVLSALRDRV